MDIIYNILHLTGAFCLIVYSVAGFALIIRWWDRLANMEAQIGFIFEVQNELVIKSKGQTPKHHHFSKEFFDKGEDVVVHGNLFLEKMKNNPPPPPRVVENSTTTETRND